MKNTLLLVVITALLSACSFFGDSENQAGWDEEDRRVWYQATQGSRLMPLSWFLALQKINPESKIASTQFLSDSFGFVEAPSNMGLSLPIGFAVDQQDDSKLTVSKLRWYATQPSNKEDAEPWLGLNCAACHTAEIHYKGREMIVDGGPNLLDFQSFIEELDKALEQTREDPDKWPQFAEAVLQEKDSALNRTLLENSVDSLMQWQRRTHNMNDTAMRYGFGRLDAVGHILNKILLFVGASDADGNEANAPVSYPFLWNIWRQERVQWNGVASNSRIKFPGDSFEYGALGRNAGEVLGVFGDIDIAKNEGVLSGIKGFNSSVDTQNLMRMELLLQSLQPPKWPEHFPEIDKNLANTGETLFADKCASCHLPESEWESDKPTERMISFFETNRTNPENLTDIWMACNAFLSDGPTGPLEGQKDNDGEVFGEEAPVATMLAASVKGAILGQKTELVKEGFNNFFGIRRPPEVIGVPEIFATPPLSNREKCLQTQDQIILGYKARPLDGIWATAPYLHNGSVSSLYELLLPADKRQSEFWTGNREYDPVKVGYVTTKSPDGSGFLLETRDAQGNEIPGNSNVGHEYGAADFTDNDRKALVEYMKGL